ncbi:MAG: HIT family protein [Candidatus Saccharimonas sp.]
MTGYTGSDIYCDRIIPRKVDIGVIKETDTILAYYHTKPFWPTHIVVTPKAHVDSLLELESPLTEQLLAVVQEVAREIKDREGAVRVQTNLGEYEDSKYLHVHVSSGSPLR